MVGLGCVYGGEVFFRCRTIGQLVLVVLLCCIHAVLRFCRRLIICAVCIVNADAGTQGREPTAAFEEFAATLEELARTPSISRRASRSRRTCASRSLAALAEIDAASCTRIGDARGMNNDRTRMDSHSGHS